MNEENKAVELTDEDLEQVSGGVNIEVEVEVEVEDTEHLEACSNYCDGKFPCQNTKCPYGYK